MTDYISRINSYYLKDKKNFSKMIKKDAELWTWILEQTSHLDEDIKIAERLYIAANPGSNICELSNVKKFNRFSDGYYNSCKDNRTCTCYLKNMSKSVQSVKAIMTDEQKEIALKKAKQTNLKKYGVENANQSIELRTKAKETNLKRYDIENPLLNVEIQKKIKRTNLERYGVENVFSNKNIQQKIKDTYRKKYIQGHPQRNHEVRNKVKTTNLERYGVANPMNQPYVIEKMRNILRTRGFDNIFKKIKFTQPLFDFENYNGKYEIYHWLCLNCNATFEANIPIGNDELPLCTTCFPIGRSSYEQDIVDFLDNLSIKTNDSSIINKELDIVISDYNLAIEMNGTYWHSELNGKDKNYHLNKTKLCEEKGIQLIHIWDSEWINKQDIVKSRLNSFVGKNQKIYARQCIIKEITTNEKDIFLNLHHIQGTCTSKYNIGLYFENKLVAIMTFGKSRFNKSYEYELLRYCSLINTNVIGGASKLFSYFLKTYKPSSVISYSDKRWSQGKLYKQLGFVHLHDSSPNYWYLKKTKIENRIIFQKHKLKDKLEIFDPKLTEWDNMQLNGYDRIWDCGNGVWGFQNNSKN